MSKPVRQHFVPRSYLKNFSENDDKKSFIFGSQHYGENIRISTKDICLQKNLYTITTGNDKFAIEHFYAENIDRVYPEIYKVLTNDNIKIIDFDTRLKIVTISLSFYFRTPKFLNKQNEMNEQMIRDFAKMTNGDSVTYSFLGEDVVFNKKEIELIIKEKKEKNRILFLSEHLRAYEKLIQLKLMDAICVYKLNDESEFITSDNPLIMRPFVDPSKPDFNYKIIYTDFDPFSKKNMIHLPLNKKYILTILPKMEDTIINYIQRLDIRMIDSLLYNMDAEKFSDKWILGSKKGIKNHYLDQKRYNEETPENIEMVNDYKEMVLEMNNITLLMEEYGVGHKKVQAKFNQLKNNPKVKADPNFIKMFDGIFKTNDNKT